MSQRRLGNLMLFYCERDIVDEIDIDRAVDKIGQTLVYYVDWKN